MKDLETEGEYLCDSGEPIAFLRRPGGVCGGMNGFTTDNSIVAPTTDLPDGPDRFALSEAMSSLLTKNIPLPFSRKP